MKLTKIIDKFLKKNGIYYFDSYGTAPPNEVDVLIKRIQEYKKKFPIHKKVPRPSHWSGWALKANEVEFWLDGDNRIHERLRYKKSGSKWKKEILYP